MSLISLIVLPFRVSLCYLTVIHGDTPFSSKSKNQIIRVQISELSADFTPTISPDVSVYLLHLATSCYAIMSTQESNIASQHHLGFVVESLSSQEKHQLCSLSLPSWPMAKATQPVGREKPCHVKMGSIP